MENALMRRDCSDALIMEALRIIIRKDGECKLKKKSLILMKAKQILEEGLGSLFQQNKLSEQVLV